MLYIQGYVSKLFHVSCAICFLHIKLFPPNKRKELKLNTNESFDAHFALQGGSS